MQEELSPGCPTWELPLLAAVQKLNDKIRSRLLSREPCWIQRCSLSVLTTRKHMTLSFVVTVDTQ